MQRIFLISLCLLYCAISKAQCSDVLSWSEEFNYKGFPDSAKWVITKETQSSHLAYYTGKNKENVNVRKGMLTLTLRKGNENGYKYESGRIYTRSHIKFGYGKLEIHAKCPTTEGVWDAIWLKPIKGKKVNGEIDLMEYIGCWKGQKYQVNFHLWGNFAGKAQNHIQKPRYAHIDISQFHVYTLEWYKERMIAKVDGNVVYDLKKEDLEEWPFDMPYQLIIALGYGPNWGGCGLDDSSLPQKLQVDWIRYYKLKD